MKRIYKVLYWIISLNLMLSTAVGVTIHVFRDPEGVGPRVPEGTTPASPEGQACRGELRDHFVTLQRQLGQALARKTAPTLQHDWQDFTVAWRRDLDRTRHHCRLETDAMAPLNEIARDLEKLRVAYTTAVNGFADTGQATLTRLETAFTAPAPASEGFPPTRPD